MKYYCGLSFFIICNWSELFLKKVFSIDEEVSLGTTILAVRYKGGVVVGADTRTSVSGYVSNRYAAKLTFVMDRGLDYFVSPVHAGKHVVIPYDGQIVETKEILNKADQNPHSVTGIASETNVPSLESSTCVICRSGSAADTQHLASIIRSEIVMRQLLYRIRGTVSHVTSLARRILLNEPSLSASLICAGYDHELKRGVIYSIARGGTTFEERGWAAGGSGSSYVLGHLDSLYTTTCDVSDAFGFELDGENEAVEFVFETIRLAMDRDGSSGGFIRMYVIDKWGKRYISRMAHSLNEDFRKNKSDYSTALNSFAPAIVNTRVKNALRSASNNM